MTNTYQVRNDDIIPNFFTIGYENPDDGSMLEQFMTESEWQAVRDELIAELDETGETIYVFGAKWLGDDGTVEYIDSLLAEACFDVCHEVHRPKA